MNIITRSFDADFDAGIIFSTWAKGFYFGGLLIKPAPKKQWFQSFHEHVKKMVEKGDIVLACLHDDPITIIGYAVFDNDTLEWIYVKEIFRGQGIAKLLTKNRKFSQVANLTKVGKILADKYGLKPKENHGNDRQAIKSIQGLSEEQS